MATLSAYIQENGLTQRALAQKLGISSQFLNQIISGVRRPGVDLTKRIESVTGIPRHVLRPDVYEAAQ